MLLYTKLSFYVNIQIHMFVFSYITCRKYRIFYSSCRKLREEMLRNWSVLIVLKIHKKGLWFQRILITFSHPTHISLEPRSKSTWPGSNTHVSSLWSDTSGSGFRRHELNYHFERSSNSCTHSKRVLSLFRNVPEILNFWTGYKNNAA